MKWSFLALLFLAPGLARAIPEEPKNVVQDIFQRASVPDIASDLKKQGEVNALVDFDALARAALGKEYKKASAADFAWFRDTLREIISRTVYPKAPDFLSGVKITYNSVDAHGAKATVKSTVQNKADLTDVDYQLEQEKGGAWKVTDVAISGQSWVESIRDEVGKVLKKNKWAGLKAKMTKRLNELKSGKA
jgi:ABC-type transporter MlaC component